ncbi:MAG: hypothetical protein KatS3mg056_2576 [Chloroflexus sp.]|nr:MAG: hypothetical protein KatS3mg056_2576 [Chloroflexus sp.]
MGRVATLRRAGARRWAPAATPIVQTGTPHGIVRSVVLFILAVNRVWPAHSTGVNLGQHI